MDIDGGSCTRSSGAAAYSSATACASATEAANEAHDGDRVYYASGAYEDQIIADRCYGDWVTFAPAPNAKVSIDGTDGGTGPDAWDLDGGSGSVCHVRIQGFDLTDRVYVEHAANYVDIVGNHIHSKVPPSRNTTWAQLAGNGVNFNTKGKPAGIHNVTIRSNRIENIGYVCRGVGSDPNACDTDDNSPSWGYCIYDLDTSELTVTGNRIDGCWEDAIQVHAATFVFAGNDVSNIENGASGHQDGIQIFAATPRTGAVIERNNFHGAVDTCLRIQDNDRYRFVIRNNVCAGTINSGLDLEHLHDSTISFNTVGKSRYGSNLSGQASDAGAEPSNDVIEDNIFMPASNGCGWTLVGTRHTYRYNLLPEACSTGGCTPGCSSNAPRFLHATNGADMRLTSGSAGVNAGVNERGATRDVGGRPRPPGSVSDIGAWERQARDP
ncbi:MAG: choice-of-anchor Q domain-containing protein [Gaiellaceae bacterium]